jgi:hypothetical protein
VKEENELKWDLEDYEKEREQKEWGRRMKLVKKI